MYAIPGLTFIGAYAAAAQTGLYPEVHQAAYLGAGLCCIGALTGLSSQSTARVGENLTITFIYHCDLTSINFHSYYLLL